MPYRFNPTTLAELRAAKGLPPEAVAIAVRRSARTIANWESGRVSITAAQLAVVLDVLGATPADVFEEAP